MSELVLSGVSRDTVRELVRRQGGPDWLASLRLHAWKLFEELPVERSTMFVRHTDFRSIALDSIDALPSSSTPPLPSELVRYVEGVEGSGAYVQLDHSSPRVTLREDLGKKGVVFADILPALGEHTDLIEPVLKKRAIPPEEDKLVALNTALFSSGPFLYVPSGVVVEEPLHIFDLRSKPAIGVFNLGIVVMGAESKAVLLREGYSDGTQLNGRQSLQSSVLEVHLGEGSELSVGDIQRFAENVVIFSHKRALCGANSRLNWVTCGLGGRYLRSNTSAVLRGSGSDVQEVEVVFGSGQQHFDMASTLDHLGEHTRGDIYSKGVFRDQARGIFKGMINIGKTGRGTDSFLSEHSMLLNPGASADAIPALEIATNEVKASHSASVAQIDDEQLFYLTSRGIRENEARKLVVRGFFESALAKVQAPLLRQRVGTLIEEKWGRSIEAR